MATSGAALLPVVGTHGIRYLDDLAFACCVVAHDTCTNTLTIQYSDDQQLEVGVLPEEFLFMEGDSDIGGPRDGRRDQHDDHAEGSFRFLCNPSTQVSAKIQSDQQSVDSLFKHVMSFLDHFQWIQSLAYVSRRWRRQLLQLNSWQTVYLPPQIVSSSSGGVMGSEAHAQSVYRMISRVELLSSRTSSSLSGETTPTMQLCKTHDTVKACEIIEKLVLDECAMNDDQVLQLVRCCWSLKSISLRRCSHVSFLLLYELTRLVKEQQPQQDSSVSSLESVDVWLCRGISPAYVSQLQSSGVCATCSRLKIKGPGFFIVEVSAETNKWITREATLCSVPIKMDRNEAAIQCQTLSIRFVSKETIRTLFESRQSDRICKQLKAVHDHLEQLPFAMVPFVDQSEILMGTAREQTRDRWQPHSLIGFPWSLEDLMQLVKQYEERDVQTQLYALTPNIMEQPLNSEKSRDDANGSKTDQESLDTRAEKVFAMLRQSTKDLESQVARLEQQVHKMTLAKEQAQQEYLHMQFALDQVAKEADRALLSLVSGPGVDVAPPPPPPPTSIFSNTVSQIGKDGDELLPLLPPNDTLQTLGSKLQSDGFAVLDQFVGSPLRNDVRDEVEHLYLSYVSKSTTHDFDNSDSEKAPEFKLGELAGGNTGRNLRYKMEHVRGDYMLWIDENDTFCPPSLCRVLRQMDRLMLERLPACNVELEYSSLLRKKAMVTCYPGNGARYTKHCDNPNKNGRKLTAILYLNADWQPEHGGELQLHLPNSPKENGHKIAPIMDRLLLFFSDRRVPHEVLPCHGRNRFALTVWYLDYDEFMNAQVFGTILQDHKEEEARIQQEITAFASNQREL